MASARRSGEEREREREVVLSSIYTSSRSRLRETGAFPSRPGIDAEERKRERPRRRREKEVRMLVFRRPFDFLRARIVNYNLFSFRPPNVRAPVPMSAFPGKVTIEIADSPFNDDCRLLSLRVLWLTNLFVETLSKRGF